MDRKDGHVRPELQLAAADAQQRGILKAIASEPRQRILEHLSDRLQNVTEIADALDMPLSTATMHINVLEEAGLLHTELQPGERGLQKVCQRVYDRLVIDLPVPEASGDRKLVEVVMPIGNYTTAEVRPSCGLVGPKAPIGLFDDPRAFLEPAHTEAQLLWFKSGSIEYRFPNRLPPKTVADSLWLSMEICSEAPMHHDDWPSDITLHLNGVKIGTWTSPADFGGQPGLLTPDWWDTRNTQFGLLKEWRVTHDGSFVDGVRVGDTTVDDLDLTGPAITMALGVEPDAEHVGGLNLFGRHFGNYPQDIVLRMRYHRAE